MSQRSPYPHDPDKGKPHPSYGSLFPAKLFTRQREQLRLKAASDAKLITSYYLMVRCINAYVPQLQQNTEFKKMYQDLARTHHLPWRTFSKHVEYAYLLKTLFKPVFYELQAGNLTLQLAHIFPEQGVGIEDEKAIETYTHALLKQALLPGQTAVKLRMFAKWLAYSLSTTPIEDRTKSRFKGLTWRGVYLEDLNDGIVELRLIMNAVDGLVAQQRLRGIAQAKRGAEKPPCGHRTPQGTLEHLTGAELLTGKFDPQYRGVKASINITVPLLSLETGISRHSVEKLQSRVGALAGLSGNAHLTGYGPVSVEDAAPYCATQREWYRMFIDPDSGVVLHTDKRRPHADLQRFIEFRDQTCR